MSIKNTVTILTEDRWIEVDGVTVEFQNGFQLIPEHDGLFALHWKDGKGEYQFDDPPSNHFFDKSEYNKFVAPYVRQWEKEKSRQKAEFEAEWNKPENVEARAREQRNTLLAETDYILMPDYPLTEEQRELWTTYRQALRDLTDQEGWPTNIVWPEKPSV